MNGAFRTICTRKKFNCVYPKWSRDFDRVSKIDFGNQFDMFKFEEAGELFKDSRGYYRIARTDPKSMFWVENKLFHRWMVEVKLGRRLTKNEVVHHINGIKTDNRIKNLRLTTSEDHSRAHTHKENLIRKYCESCDKIWLLNRDCEGCYIKEILDEIEEDEDDWDDDWDDNDDEWEE